MSNNPMLVVLTPVRNEAWILRAFLSATSLWADKIIIADQMSTDGSREIYNEYPKVHVIDNNQAIMHQAATRRLLFAEANKLIGNTDAVLFALDADEFLSGDFMHTNFWHKIVTSQPDDVFCWSWMNISPTNHDKYSTHEPYGWAIHVSPNVWEGTFPNKFIHEWRLPWSSKTDQSKIFTSQDFYSIHFAWVNVLRQHNKERFYQVSSLATKSSWNILNIYRMYHAKNSLNYYDVPINIYDWYLSHGVDIWSMIDLNDEGSYYTQVVLDYFHRDGLQKYALLDIWDNSWCKSHHIQCPQRWYHLLIMKYLEWSGNHRNLFTRGIDYLWKRL